MAETVAPSSHSNRKFKKRPNWTNIAVLGLVHALAMVGAWTIISGGVSVMVWALFALFYLIGNLGVTVGYHRGFTHRGYAIKPGLKYVLLAAAAQSWQGLADCWISDHRRHHKYADVPGLDPHSPFEYANRLKGLLWAHIGWMLCRSPITRENRVDEDLKRDPHIQWQRRWYVYVPLGLIGFVLPFLLAGWPGLFVAGFLRLACLYHITWSVNSVCHWIGTHAKDSRGREFRRDDSRNNWLVALLGSGEGYHSNHHAQPTWAYHGWKWWNIDASKWVIAALERVRLVSNVRKPRPFDFPPTQTLPPKRVPVDRQMADV